MKRTSHAYRVYLRQRLTTMIAANKVSQEELACWASASKVDSIFELGNTELKRLVELLEERGE